MPAKINLIGQKFGKLTVLEETPMRKNKSIVWRCRCDCGNEIELSTKELRNDGIIQCKQCGTNRSPSLRRENIIGKKYNRLIVLDISDKRQGGKIAYKCQCDCGNITYVTRTDLINGHTQSCGCIRQKYKIGDVINNREIINITGTKNDYAKGNFYYRCKCLLCGREYDALASTIDSTISCGCQRSIGEYNIIKVLQKNNISYQKEYRLPKSDYRFDFVIFNDDMQPTRLIEFDGEQHYKDNIKNVGWNTYEKYEYTYKNDLAKNKLAKDFNIPLVRIPYWERDNISIGLILGDKYLII